MITRFLPPASVGPVLALLTFAGIASAQVTVDGKRNEPNNSNPYSAPVALQKSDVISFENAPRVTMCFQSNQSNIGGKGAYSITGTQSAPNESDPALVKTGVECTIRLTDLGLTSLPTEILITGFVNGGGHDFLANQVFRGATGDPGNFGEPRLVNFETVPGEQFIRVNTAARSAAAPVIDGVATEAGYVTFPQAAIGSGFGSANLNPPLRNRANGSEIDNVSAYIYNNGTAGNPNDDVLVLHIAGNLESNFNKLDLFIDYIALQGQNVLASNNPDVGFNGLNRMGTNTAGSPNSSAPMVMGPGLTFDLAFRPDYWISVTVGGGTPPASPTIFIDCAQLLSNGAGVGGFAGGAPNLDVPGTPGVFNLVNGNSPPAGGFSLDINNSNSDAPANSGGVGGRINSPGSGSQADISNPAGVATGFEFKVNLDGIGYTIGSGGAIKIAGILLGNNYDFMSNNAIGGLTSPTNMDPNNLGFPANGVDLRDWTGDQFVNVPVPGSLPAGSGSVINGSLDGAEAGLYGAAKWINTTNASGFGDSVSSMTFTPGPHRSNGSELDAVYFYIATDPTDSNKPKLYGLVTGNLHDFNKIVLFLDTNPTQGQPDIRGDNAAFDGGRLNTGLGGVDGFQFDEGIAPDYAIVYAAGFDTNLAVPRHFAFGAQLLTGGGGYGGSFGGGDKTNTTAVCGTVIAREGFGNNTISGINEPGAIRTVNADGSELDSAYIRVVPDGSGSGTMYMFFGGNLEPNLTSLEIFFDTRTEGGQNTLIFSSRSPQDPLYDGNPDVDFGALNRMGGPFTDDAMVVHPGLTFDSTFAPDYYFSFRAGNYDATLGQVSIFGNYARLRTLGDPAGPLPDSADRYLGIVTNDIFDSFGPAFISGDVPESISAAALANNNTGGVPGGRLFYCPGSPTTDPATVLTGFEVALDLADLGYGNGPGLTPYVPGTSPLTFTVFLNGFGHGDVSNQSLQHGCTNDLGEPRDVNYNNVTGNQYVGFPTPVAVPPNCTQPFFLGDANSDGVVSFSDVTSSLANFNNNYQPGTGVGDANGDGVVNFGDIIAILGAFNNLAPSCNP